MPPPFQTLFPTVIVPGELPGAMAPPELMVTAPSVPLPVRVPPALICVVALASEEVTARVPALTVMAPA